MSRQAITPARWCGLMTNGMMEDRSSVIGLTREYRPNWSFSTILCRNFDRPQWVRIAKVALHYITHFLTLERPDSCVRQLDVNQTLVDSSDTRSQFAPLRFLGRYQLRRLSPFFSHNGASMYTISEASRGEVSTISVPLATRAFEVS